MEDPVHSLLSTPISPRYFSSRALRPGPAHLGLSGSGSTLAFSMAHAQAEGEGRSLPPLDPSIRLAGAPGHLPQESFSPWVSDSCIWSPKPPHSQGLVVEGSPPTVNTVLSWGAPWPPSLSFQLGSVGQVTPPCSPVVASQREVRDMEPARAGPMRGCQWLI